MLFIQHQLSHPAHSKTSGPPPPFWSLVRTSQGCTGTSRRRSPRRSTRTEIGLANGKINKFQIKYTVCAVCSANNN